MLKPEMIKKFLKEVLITLFFLTIAMNLVSYFRAPTLDSDRLPPIVTTLIDQSSFSTQHLNEKPLLIHFWATWCPTCKLEASNIERLSQHFEVITVAVKSGGNREISEYMQQNDYTFKVINDASGDLASQFKVPAFPTSFIYNSKGHLEFSEVGYSSTIGLFLRMWWAQ